MHLFPKILVANRGEIAVRIIRTAKKMGISTVAIHSGEERDALHVGMADEARELRGSSLQETYLDPHQITAIAKESKAAAIHPGYGFLSENEAFAASCENAGIVFIGPRSQTIALMGNKIKAREAALKAGLPVTEGFTGNAVELAGKAAGMKFPVLVKAAAGGGGKGMRLVLSPAQLPDAIEATSREALAWFGDSSVYIEQYIENPRHIEIQLLADNHGNVIHLYERECSLQRRYQKIIEEAPSPAASRKTIEAMGDAAVSLAKSIGYRNAGTIEFLVDPAGNFYFLEMNTRIQVEHPVTEAVTGLDIVEEQIFIAANRKLRHSGRQIKINGHAIECRIYAEEPAEGFIPSPGTMTLYHEPEGEGIRVDSGYSGMAVVSANYDPMIGKLIAAGRNREDARQKLISALENFGVHGIKTNIGFLLSLLRSKDFIAGDFSTGYCEKNIRKILEDENNLKRAGIWQIPATGALLASLHRKAGKNSLWEKLGYWRMSNGLKFCFEGEMMNAEIGHLTDTTFRLTINNKEFTGKYLLLKNRIRIWQEDSSHEVFVSETGEGQYLVAYRGFDFSFRRNDFLKTKDFFVPRETNTSPAEDAVYSPMPGRVIKVNKITGDNVLKGEVMVVVESMKMENSIQAPADGIVKSMEVRVGELVNSTTPLFLLQNSKSTRKIIE